MLKESFTVRQTTTEEYTIVLIYGNGRPRDLTGVTSVALVLIPSDGTGTRTEITTAANPTKLRIITATQGRIGWKPANGDVTAANSRYLFYCAVNVDGSTKEIYGSENQFIKVTVN